MASNPLVFNTDGMRAIASQITSQATRSLSDHDLSWNRLQGHLQSYPGLLQNLLYSVTNTHQQHLRQSYHWQLAFASVLSASADDVDQVEAEITQMFL